MKQTQNKQTGLVLGISAILMLGMVSVQNVYADPNEPTRPGFGFLSIFGDDPNEPTRPGFGFLSIFGDDPNEPTRPGFSELRVNDPDFDTSGAGENFVIETLDDPNEPTRPGFAKHSIFGDDPNEPTKPGMSIWGIMGDEENPQDPEDPRVPPVSSVDDVHAKCDVWSFWIPMPQSCIKDGMRSTELPCESFGRVC